MGLAIRERVQQAWKKLKRFWKVYIGWRIRRWWYAFIHGYRFPPLPRECWPDNWFYVVSDSQIDAEEIDPTHTFNIKTGEETIVCFPLDGPKKIPREERISYSEYERICEELAKKQSTHASGEN